MKTSSRRWALVALALAPACAAPRAASGPGSPAPIVSLAESVAPLAERFDRDAAMPRFVTLLSPT